MAGGVRGIVAGAVAALAAAAFAPAAQAGDDLFLVRAAESKNGNYGVEIQDASVPVGETENFFFRVRSKVNSPRRISFSDFLTDSPPQLRVRWFTDDGDNVTSEVKGDGERFRLPGRGTEFFELRVRATDEVDDCITGRGDDRDIDFAASATIGINTQCF